MTAALVRHRSLMPLDGLSGALEGWMDDDAALAAGQLFGGGPSGLLVIDARELLVSTARVVGLELGDLHFRRGCAGHAARHQWHASQWVRREHHREFTACLGR